MNTFTQCFIKKSDFVTRCIGGETIFVPVRGHVGDLESIYIANEVGTLIWELIDARTSVSRIVEAICEAYDVTPDEAAKDAVEFLRSLEAAGLIHPAVESE